MRYILQKVLLFSLGVAYLLLLAGCSNGNSTSRQTQVGKTPTATLTVQASQGTQLLKQSAQLLSSAQTTHGVFNATISGQQVNGEVDSEVWRKLPALSRSLVLKSTISQLPVGFLNVSNGKTAWEYDPTKNVVYTGPATSTTDSGLPGSTQAGGGQLSAFGIVQAVLEQSTATVVSSTQKVNGRPVYVLSVTPDPQASSASANSLNYTGTVSLDQQTHLPVAMDLTFQELGHVQLAISGLVLNTSLANSLFTFTAPANAKVEPLPTASGASGSLTLQQAEQQAGYHLLSIPVTQTAYKLTSIDALGASGNQIYTFSYSVAGQSFTLSEGKALANLPVSGEKTSLRGTTATLATNSDIMTLTWTEKGVGIQITGTLTRTKIIAIAQVLA